MYFINAVCLLTLAALLGEQRSSLGLSRARVCSCLLLPVSAEPPSLQRPSNDDLSLIKLHRHALRKQWGERDVTDCWYDAVAC